jgi:hypothetical protein
MPVFGKFESIDALQYDGLWDIYNHCAMGICAEDTATKQGITRESQDAHCIESYKRAAAAWKSGAFAEEIAPVIVKGKKGDTVVTEDEEYKNAMFDKVPTLRPAFKKDGGTVTAANSSKLNDGASVVILMSESKAKELGLKPLAKILCKCDTHARALFDKDAQLTRMPESNPSNSRLHPRSLSQKHLRRRICPFPIFLCSKSMKRSQSSSELQRKS